MSLFDPDIILAKAALAPTPQAAFIRNPYARAATEAYDKHRFPHNLIPQLELYLYSFAKDRFIAEKATHFDHLTQEAMRVGRLTAERGGRYLSTFDFDFCRFSQEWEIAKSQGVKAIDFI